MLDVNNQSCDPKLSTMAKRGPKEITDAHKAAMSVGRAEGKIVREYLETLRKTKPKRGRKRTPDSINSRLDKINQELASANPLDELKLIQERRDLEAELKALSSQDDLSELEDQFAKVAKSYGDRKGISYGSWREVGVSAAVLKRAGITRGA